MRPLHPPIGVINHSAKPTNPSLYTENAWGGDNVHKKQTTNDCTIVHPPKKNSQVRTKRKDEGKKKNCAACVIYTVCTCNLWNKKRNFPTCLLLATLLPLAHNFVCPRSGLVCSVCNILFWGFLLCFAVCCYLCARCNSNFGVFLSICSRQTEFCVSGGVGGAMFGCAMCWVGDVNGAERDVRGLWQQTGWGNGQKYPKICLRTSNYDADAGRRPVKGLRKL